MRMEDHSLPDRKPLLSHNNEEIGAIEVELKRHKMGAKRAFFVPSMVSMKSA